MRYETQGTGKNKTQRLVIYYKFVGYLDIDPTQCHPNYTADIREGVAIEYVSCEPSDSLKELFPEGYGVVDDDSFEEAETEQAETCSGHDNKKVDATKIRYIHLIWLRWLSAFHLLAEKAGDRLRELALGFSGGGAAARGS